MDCNDIAFSNLFYIVRNILNLIWIISPILAIICLIVYFTFSLKNPDDQKNLKRIKNAMFGLVVLFLIPTIVHAVMLMLKDSTDYSLCWNDANNIHYNNIDYIPITNEKGKSIISNPSDYEKGKKEIINEKNQDSNGTIHYSQGEDYGTSSCGELEYCTKYLNILYTYSKRLEDTIRQNHASVEYSNSNFSRSWGESFSIASNGGVIRINCASPSNWSMREAIAGMDNVWFWSPEVTGGFRNYTGAMTSYTKQLLFDGSINVKTAIQKGIIQPGDVVGTKRHTFSIYRVNQATGSAVVVDGGGMYTSRCQKGGLCSPMFEYGAETNNSFPLFQVIRWVR